VLNSCVDLVARIGEAAVETVAQVFSCVRYKRAALELVTAKQRRSERTSFYGLIKRLKAADDLENAATRTSEWAQVVSELVPLYEGVNAEKLLEELANVLEQHRDSSTARREIWAAGPFLDLPHHESSKDETRRMVSELEQFLHANALDASHPPAIVTIAKSTGDEYLPPYQLDDVLSSVLQMLECVYGELETNVVEYEPVQDAGDEDNVGNTT
jgi:hypothetical protein